MHFKGKSSQELKRVKLAKVVDGQEVGLSLLALGFFLLHLFLIEI